jgi:hypothetical protein
MAFCTYNLISLGEFGAAQMINQPQAGLAGNNQLIAE